MPCGHASHQKAGRPALPTPVPHTCSSSAAQPGRCCRTRSVSPKGTQGGSCSVSAHVRSSSLAPDVAWSVATAALTTAAQMGTVLLNASCREKGVGVTLIWSALASLHDS